MAYRKKMSGAKDRRMFNVTARKTKTINLSQKPMRGVAADIRVNGMRAKELANELNGIAPEECGIIVYKSWVHIDVRESKYR